MMISLEELANLRGSAEENDSADAIIDAIDDRWQALQDARASGVDIATVCRIALPVLDLLRALCSLAPQSTVKPYGQSCNCR